MKFKTIDELLKYTKNIIGKTFKELDTDGRLNNGLGDKGILGKIVETGFYNYPNNNIASADFENLGVELKVTGYVRNKNGSISAKERLVLSKINYNDIINEEFDFSKLIFKNKKILIIWYEYDYTKDIKDFVITNYQLYDMSDDALIIKNDYEIIKEKVIEGNAHLLSEGDTSFLGACVKGENGDEKIGQPNSKYLAKPRAFSLKHSYLTGILRDFDVTLDVDNQEYKTVEDYVFAQIKKFIGKTQIDIYMEIMERTLTGNIPKNIGKLISDKLIGTDEELPEKNPLFAKTNYRIKNIPVDSDFKPLERTPFRTIRLSEFNENWDNSEWKIFFEELTIIAICYEGTKEIANGYRVLKDIRKISFTSDEIDSFGKTYNMVKDAIESHDISKLPYPNSFDNQYLEVAPKGQKGANAYDTFFDNDKTKVCFMMNKEFIYKKLTENDEQSGDNGHLNNDNVGQNDDSSHNVNIKNYNIFKLFDYGISIFIISNLADNRIPPYNIYANGIAELDNLDIQDAKKKKLYSAVREMIDNNDYQRSIYELLYCGVSKSTCDNLVKKELTIDKIKKLSPEELKDNYSVGNVIALKLKSNISEIEKVIEESNNNLNTKLILEEIIKENTKEEPITLFKLKQILSKATNYIIDNFADDYTKLQIENKIKIGMYGIEYNFLNFEDYINNNFDERVASIIKERYNGNTLEAIAQRYGLTRERVRQICKKIKLDEIEDNLVEDKYKNVFEKYNWTKQAFIEIFNEKEFTYNYLNERYIKGNEDLTNILTDSDFDDSQKERLKAINKLIITTDGDLISNTNDFIRRVLVKYANNEIDIDDLTDIYNDEIEKYPELQLNNLNSRNLEARLSRSDYAFFGANHKVRYYDFNSLSDESIDQLKELIILNDGFYSTEYLFRNNRQLMNELDIRNENELHNILKLKIDDNDNNVYFLRMPNFLVEYRDKDEFIVDKIREYSPILINDFIDVLYEEYGHKKATMLSYLTSNFNSYIKDGYFDIDTMSLSEEEINVLRNKLTKDIYSLDEVREILETNGYEDAKMVLTNRNFNKLGYKLRGSYVIKSEYGRIYGYFDNKIENESVIKLDESIIKIGAIYNAINYYCKQLKIFKLSNNIFITDKKLLQLGITKQDLEQFIGKIREKFYDKDYFSVNNVTNEIDCSIFENIGLSESFIDDLISNLDDIKTLRINNNRLYSFSKYSLSITEFMYDMVNKYSSISLEDLEKEIAINYQISVPFDKLRGYLYSTDIFYSDILEKIYSDKNNYYEEVYND